MRALVVYDSTYGHTEQIARAIGEAIAGEALRVGEVEPTGLKASNLLIVGSPTHGGRYTEEIQGLLDALPALEGVDVAAFDTRTDSIWNRLLPFGYAAPRIASVLEMRGGNLVASPEGFVVLGIKGPLREGELERAAGWARMISAAAVRQEMIELPGIGKLTYDSKLKWYFSDELMLRVLGGHLCRIVLAGYDEDDNKQDFHTAAGNFLTIGPSVLRDAEEAVYQYYRDCVEYLDLEAGDNPRIDSPHDVWEHVQFGGKALVVRRAYGARGVYVSLECECDWEEEHGLQIVFRNGLQVNKVGAYDGHCTNADAYGDERLEDVIYRAL